MRISILIFGATAFCRLVVGEGPHNVSYKIMYFNGRCAYSGTATGLQGDIYTFSEIDKFLYPNKMWTCHTHLKVNNKAIII
jgi:hypothetical protein